MNLSKHITMVLVLALAALQSNPAQAIRLKDVAEIEGVRDNPLTGLGIVIGLNGTGDGSSNAFTNQSVQAVLKRHGLTVDSSDIKAKNVATVMVTATLPSFARPGSKIDTLVNSIGDATNLQGGTLLLTPLKGPDGKVYAVAQGPLSVGGFGVESGGNAVQKNHPTVARIPNGADVEDNIDMPFDDRDWINVLLHNPDFTTASNIAKSINRMSQDQEGANDVATALDAGTVRVMLSASQKERLVSYIAEIESVPVFPDQAARIIVDERTGTVIMSEEVRISTVAIAQGDLTFQISSIQRVVQPEPFARQGDTALEVNSGISATEENVNLTVLRESVSLSEVVSGLNALGLTARDLISILQSLKAAGALQAEIEIR